MILKILLLLLLTTLGSCGQAGWNGYYETYPKTTVNKYIAESVINSTQLVLNNKAKIDLELPRDCDSFMVAGIITPFTPPIPLPVFRSWHWEKEDSCNYFTAQTRPQAKVQLKLNNKIYEPKELEGKWGYTKYIFPVRAKNIDYGSILIEKDGEKIEVPFEYKYFKFWY